MLDNASGSSTILDIAQKMKNVNPLNKLRFIWFGGEENGELGSSNYLDSLSSNDASHIGYDLDADVTATPNYRIGLLDPACDTPSYWTVCVTPTLPVSFPNQVYKASTVARDQMINYFHSINLNHELMAPSFPPTDALTFNEAGIPASGLTTGQNCCKTDAEVQMVHGYPGNFEGTVPGTDGGCVDVAFKWCDNLSNNDPTVLTWATRAVADSVVRLAFDNNIMTSSNNAVYKVPIGEPDQ